MRNTAAHAPTARSHRRGWRGSQIMTGAPRRPTARTHRWGPGRRHPRSSRVRASRHHSSGSLRGETVAHGLDLVGEEDELLATVEVDGEERAGEVLALRDERPRGSPSGSVMFGRFTEMIRPPVPIMVGVLTAPPRAYAAGPWLGTQFQCDLGASRW